MHTTIRRLTVVGLCAAWIGSGASVASADSSLSATTLGAYALTNEAAVYGTVSTGGPATNWAFEYGTTNKYGSYTQLQSIPAGAATPQAVYAVLTNLTPGTTYHYQLLAANGAQYSLGAYGGDRTFTTPTAGNIQLQSRNFTVKKGSFSVPIKCASTQGCKGKLTITTAKKVHKKTKILTCAKKSFSGKAGSSQRVSVKLAKACTAGAKKGGKLKAKLLMVLTTGQPKLSKNIVIKL